MEFRRYWRVLARRWLVVVALPLLVGIGSLALFAIRPVTYTATTRVQLVIVPPQTNNDAFFRYADYYNFLATEYMVDDLVEVLNGNVFTQDVANTLAGPDFKVGIPVDHIRGALDVTRLHRVIIIAATSTDRGLATTVARAAVKTLQADPVRYFSRGGSGSPINAKPLVIDEPLAAHSNRVKSLLNAALQTLVALFAGIGLAFFLEYLDDHLRDPEDVASTLQLPVMAKVPRGPALSRRSP